MEEKYQKIMEIVKEELSCSAHNMEHILRVYNLCLHVAEEEPDVDLDVLKTAALLHDIARVKEDNDDSGDIDHAVLGAEMAGDILASLGYNKDTTDKIRHCIATHRFRSVNEPETKEAQILFDADKLDIFGAIGIARLFIIAGQYDESTYSDVPVDEYIKDNLVGGKSDGRIKVMSEHSPNLEFETKIRYIPQRLYTPKAKEIGQERLEYMSRFFERMKKEISGEI